MWHYIKGDIIIVSQDIRIRLQLTPCDLVTQYSTSLIDLDNSLLLDGTEPLSVPVSTYCQLIP